MQVEITCNTGLRKVAEIATKLCAPRVIICVPADSLTLLMTHPVTVLTTDNICQPEDLARLPQQLADCQEELEGVAVTAHLCYRIGQTVHQCVRATRIGCFSERENTALAEVLEIALVKAREVFAMDEVLEMLSARQSKLGKCALGSGEQSGGNTSTFFYICVALVCLHIVI